jgi:hypothetical protein
MDEDFAFNHSPNSPLWDTLDQYHKVNFENIEEGKYYYYKHGNYIEDYIVQVDHKSNDKVTLITKYKRRTTNWGVGPNAKYEEMDRQDFVYVPTEWKEVDYEAKITFRSHELDNDQLQGGLRQLYIYDEDVVMQNGGVRRGGLIGKIAYGSYKDGSLIFKDKTGYYIIQASKNMKMYKKHLKGWKPSKNDTRECFVNKHWKSCKTRKAQKASKKSIKQTRRNN